MSAVSKDYAALAASTSTLLESSMMEGDELYDPTTVPIANEEWSKKGGTSNLCRLCANTSDYFIPIFEGEGLEHELSEKIDKHLPIKVCDSDSLPIHVCYQCASTLIAWHDLLLNCVEAEKKLLQIQQQVEQDDLEESKNIEFDAAPSMDSDNAEDSVEATTPLVTPEEMEKSAPSTSKKNTSIKERPSLKRPLAKKSASSQKKARKTETEISPVGPEDGPAEEETVIGRWKQTHLTTPYGVLHEADIPKWFKNEESESEIVEMPDRPIFECDYCGKILASRENIRVHLRIHTGERPFTCHVCGKCFKAPSGIKRHLKEVHEGVKDQTCEVCSRSFANRRTLEDHLRIHSGERPFVCAACGKTFKTKASLHVHNRSHSDVYPFPCSQCNCKFHTQHSLSVHLLRHTGEKPHACNVCGRRFRIKYELGRHKLVHSEYKPFVCMVCGHSFRQRKYLMNHNKTHHRECFTELIVC